MNEVSQQMEASSKATSRCFIFIYFLLPHWVPATCRRRRRPVRETAHYTSAAADLPVQPLNDIIGADASPVFTGKITVSQRFLNTVLHLFDSLFQLHFFQLGHHSFRFFTGGLLAFLGMDRLSILATNFTLERGTTENTLR